jgi:outer membrane protein, heavy metal efflux system
MKLKMKTIVIITIQLLIISAGYPQNTIENILNEIEKNHTGLKAFQAELDAHMLGNKTGIYLQNPEFEYAWFAGSPSNIGSKTNISFRQHFDFPSAYRHRINLSNARNQQLVHEYEEQKFEILLQARLLCLELVFTNAMANEYQVRLEHAKQIANAYDRMLQEGHTTIIEYNKARLNLLNLQKEVESNSITRKNLVNKLTAMNGGVEITLTTDEFPSLLLPTNFDQWYEQKQQQNPVLQWMKQQIEIGEKQLQLQRAENLPSFNTGYVSETLTHEQFRGFAVGLTIPLFESRNTIKYARANILARQSMEQNSIIQNFQHTRSSYERALSLSESFDEYRSIAETLDNTELLSIAHNQGQLSLTAYIQELYFIYQSIDRMLKMELELHQEIAVLFKYGN